MVSKKEVVSVMSQLSSMLNKTNPNADLTNYVDQSLQTIKKSDGVAFTGQLQYFFNHAPIVKFSNNIKLTPEEQALWNKLFSLNELGNNLWGASL